MTEKHLMHPKNDVEQIKGEGQMGGHSEFCPCITGKEVKWAFRDRKYVPIGNEDD